MYAVVCEMTQMIVGLPVQYLLLLSSHNFSSRSWVFIVGDFTGFFEDGTGNPPGGTWTSCPGEKTAKAGWWESMWFGCIVYILSRRRYVPAIIKMSPSRSATGSSYGVFEVRPALSTTHLLRPRRVSVNWISRKDVVRCLIRRLVNAQHTSSLVQSILICCADTLGWIMMMWSHLELSDQHQYECVSLAYRRTVWSPWMCFGFILGAHRRTRWGCTLIRTLNFAWSMCSSYLPMKHGTLLRKSFALR